MSFFGSIKGKFSKKSSNNPFFQDSKDTPSDPPPAYTQNAAPVAQASSALNVPRAPSAASSRASRISRDMVTNDDDPYAFLTSFDTIFLIDDSYSMTGSRWEQVRQVLKNIVPICTKRDKDGIDLYFINHRSSNTGDASEGKADGGYYNISNPDTVTKIFNDTRPSGCTPTGGRLRSILKPYLAKLDASGDPESVKPINIIVITDGVPTDDPESVIVQAARKLDDMDAPCTRLASSSSRSAARPPPASPSRSLMTISSSRAFAIWWTLARGKLMAQREPLGENSPRRRFSRLFLEPWCARLTGLLPHPYEEFLVERGVFPRLNTFPLSSSFLVWCCYHLFLALID
uniref:VWFA domain-containing protein n=1 Tax=Bionectria ochroleuca TaxID=29856 RepID=A0A8H7TUP7_BIOOC